MILNHYTKLLQKKIICIISILTQNLLLLRYEAQPQSQLHCKMFVIFA